jgi:hypothetical protein
VGSSEQSAIPLVAFESGSDLQSQAPIGPALALAVAPAVAPVEPEQDYGEYLDETFDEGENRNWKTSRKRRRESDEKE